MRILFLLLLLFHLLPVRAQRLDPDQNPYWTRYTFVEDSSVLVPLKGDYRVYYLQSGMWWNMSVVEYPIRSLPEESMRLLPLFGPGLPAFRATPARGKDLPEVRLVVVRDQDTMVVELSVYYRARGGEVDERCKGMDCKRRPPMVLPFRPGRYLPIGRAFNKEYYAMDEEEQVDARTVSLTKQFDVLWKKAMKEERVVTQLNTDTCRQEIILPPPLDPTKTSMRDSWVLRSAYCGTHFVHFPLKGTRTSYIITFNPYRPDEGKDPITLDTSARNDVNYWLDVSGWPIGETGGRSFLAGVLLVAADSFWSET